MMIRAAGILFLTPDNHVLLLRRSAQGDHAGEWCFPGGKVEDGETVEQAAERETIEEVGFLPKGDRQLWTRRQADGIDFTTFFQRVDAEFRVAISGEHTDFAWMPVSELTSAGRADAEFSEADHPRGQPGNAGQFGSGGGSGKTEENGSAASKETSAPNHISQHAVTALKAYTGADYRQVQGHLRGGKPADEATKQTISKLDEMMASASLPEPKTVYRALGSLAVQQMLGKPPTIKKGQEIQDLGFPSTSENEAVARQFFSVGANTVLMSIKAPKGSKALDISKHSDAPNERETIIARNARFKVVKWDPKSRKLEVELMPHKSDEARKDSQSTAKPAEEASADRKARFGYESADGLTVHPGDSDENSEVFDLS